MNSTHCVSQKRQNILRLDQDECDTALVHLNRLLKNFSDSDVVPEAWRFKGVTSYKPKNDPSHLKEAHAQLLNEYPASRWARRSHPYRLIQD